MSNVKNALKRDKLNLWIVAKNVNNPPIKNLPYNDDDSEDLIDWYIGIPEPKYRAKAQMVFPFPVFAVFKNVYNDDTFLIDFTKRNMDYIIKSLQEIDSKFPGYADMVENQVASMVASVSKSKGE